MFTNKLNLIKFFLFFVKELSDILLKYFNTILTIKILALI